MTNLERRISKLEEKFHSETNLEDLGSQLNRLIENQFLIYGWEVNNSGCIDKRRQIYAIDFYWDLKEFRSDLSISIEYSVIELMKDYKNTNLSSRELKNIAKYFVKEKVLSFKSKIFGK